EKKLSERWGEKKEEKSEKKGGDAKDVMHGMGEMRESAHPPGAPGADWGGGKRFAKDVGRIGETGGLEEKKSDDRPEARAAKTEDARAGGVTSVPGAGKGPKSGILTAGSFDDNLDRMPYRSFLKQFGQDSAVRDLPGRFLGHRLVLTARDGGNRP